MRPLPIVCALPAGPDAVGRRAEDATPSAALADSQLVALARAACAADRLLRRPFLRGRWRNAHLERVAAAAIARGVSTGQVHPDAIADATRQAARRLAALLDQAHPTADGWNSLAEHLAGRAPTRPDRLVLLTRPPTGPRSASDGPRAPPSTPEPPGSD